MTAKDCRTILFAALLCACGGNSKDSAKSADEASEGGGSEGEKGGSEAAGDASGAPSGRWQGGIPTKCARQDAEVCLPPDKFVNALCNAGYPSVALVLFASGTPWTHAYMMAETKAVYAAGGASSNESLRIDEEVLVLRKRSASSPGGIQVSGNEGSYAVLRWDGACATVSPGELSFHTPSKVKNARIIWSTIEADIREKLKENTTIYDAYVKWKRSCKGVTYGDVTKDCEKADGELSTIVAEQVRASGGVPTPKKIPEPL